jgi:hypothetical protein
MTVEGQNWIRTDLGGFITHLSDDAALMLGMDRPQAAGRRLPAFFNDDRSGVYRDMRAAHDTRAAITCRRTLQPREHGPVSVIFVLQYVEERQGLLWTFVRTETGLPL